MTKENSDKLAIDIQKFLDQGGSIDVLPPSKINSELKYLNFEPILSDEEVGDLDYNVEELSDE